MVCGCSSGVELYLAKVNVESSNLFTRSISNFHLHYKLSDSGGLYLLVMPSGGKYWRLKYRVFGKEKLLSIDTYQIITLAEARGRSLQAKKLLVDNIDPSQAKREAKLKQAINTAHLKK